jgi:hypothetical protein
MSSGKWCPFIGKNCKEHKCVMYTQIQGSDPQTGEPINRWGCAIAWMPTLTIEVAQKVNQSSSAVDSMKNEMVKQNKLNQMLKMKEMNSGVIPADISVDPPLLG